MSNIFYLRVSTDAQKLDRQEALAASLSPDRVYREKLSGKTADRPALKAMLAYLRDGDVLHVESISRLARSTRDLLSIVDQLTAKGVNFVSHKEAIDTTTPQGRFVLTIFAALSELEREVTLQRVREGLAAAKQNGRIGGRPAVKRPADFLDIMRAQVNHEITVEEACKRLGLSRSKYFEFKKQVPGHC